jgi:uncharacterized membrane protein YphA (DoxX/SURF4 family)
MNAPRLGLFAALALVALRVAIGVHFFAEGKTKYKDGKPFSAPFFNASKGPFAPFYKGNIWDRDGKLRRDVERAKATWESFRARAAAGYGFDQEQVNASAARLEVADRELKTILSDWKDDIDEYDQHAARRDRNLEKPERQLSSFQVHENKIASEANEKKTPWLSAIDKLWTSVERDINGIARLEQQKYGPFKLGKPGVKPGDSEFMDRLIPGLHMGIGFCLIIGLFTRTAATAAAAFLASVVVAQWPWTPGASPTYYQSIEMFAALALVGMNAGKYAGVDYLISGLISNCCGRKIPADSPPPKGAHA